MIIPLGGSGPPPEMVDPGDHTGGRFGGPPSPVATGLRAAPKDAGKAEVELGPMEEDRGDTQQRISNEIDRIPLQN